MPKTINLAKILWPSAGSKQITVVAKDRTEAYRDSIPSSPAIVYQVYSITTQLGPGIHVDEANNPKTIGKGQEQFMILEADSGYRIPDAAFISVQGCMGGYFEELDSTHIRIAMSEPYENVVVIAEGDPI